MVVAATTLRKMATVLELNLIFVVLGFLNGGAVCGSVV